MNANTALLGSLGLGVLLEVGGYALLRRLVRLRAPASAALVGMLVLGLYLAWALAAWPGADVVAIHAAIYLVTAYILGVIGGRGGGARLHWAPLLIVGFFVFVVSVDVIFVTLSSEGLPSWLRARMPPARTAQGPVTTRFPGVLEDHYYQREAEYNAWQERMRIQAERGWSVRKGWLAEHPVAGREMVFQIVVSDRAGAPVAGAAVHGRFMRPADSSLDRPFSMHEVEAGRYQASLVLPEPGRWELRLEIRRGEDVHEVRAVTLLDES